jgi:hypothetical protein
VGGEVTPLPPPPPPPPPARGFPHISQRPITGTFTNVHTPHPHPEAGAAGAGAGEAAAGARGEAAPHTSHTPALSSLTKVQVGQGQPSSMPGGAGEELGEPTRTNTVSVRLRVSTGISARSAPPLPLHNTRTPWMRPPPASWAPRAPLARPSRCGRCAMPL